MNFANSTTISVAAHTTKSVDIDTYYIPSGYSVFALRNFSIGNSGFALTSVYPSGATVYNLSSSATSIKPQSSVVFIKSEYYH